MSFDLVFFSLVILCAFFCLVLNTTEPTMFQFVGRIFNSSIKKLNGN